MRKLKTLKFAIDLCFPVEAKYGSSFHTADPAISVREDEGTDSSASEEEDDNGMFASETLDADFAATLKAIKSRNPCIYEKNAQFYTEEEEIADDSRAQATEAKSAREEPLFLGDYHRTNLLNSAGDFGNSTKIRAFGEEQKVLKDALVKELYATVQEQDMEANVDSDDGNGDLFTIKHSKQSPVTLNASGSITTADVERADKDPEAYLASFLDSRAWITTPKVEPHAFESDDEEDDRRAEEFEEAYNMRFEDPKKASERIVSHARDATARLSIRHESASRRKRAREAQHAQKEDARLEREREKAFLRKLRIEEAMQKLERIQEAAGLRKSSINVDEWSEFLLDDWDDARWEREMRTRFGDQYYADCDITHADGDLDSQRKKLKKPKWKEDIDITDIAPNFEGEAKTTFSILEVEDQEPTQGTVGTKIDQLEQKRESRKQKRKLEQLVNEHVDLDIELKGQERMGSGLFRYRESSPLNYGLTHRDILLASDSQLNQFAGLKKISTFRDAEKIRKDKRRLGKKARLRQWRKDTFGNEEGPQDSFHDSIYASKSEIGTDNGRARNYSKQLPTKSQHFTADTSQGTGKRRKT